MSIMNKYDIKEPLLVTRRPSSSEGNSFIIRRDNFKIKGQETKLGDVFYEMPFGLVMKAETGLGATTLEIKAERNSIIVEP